MCSSKLKAFSSFKMHLSGCRQPPGEHMQPVAYPGCPKEPWRQPFPVDIHDWHAVPKSRLQTGKCGRKPQDTVARVHTDQVIMPIGTKLLNKEHVTEALCRAKFKFPAASRSTSSRSGDLLSLRLVNLKAWWILVGYNP